LAVGREAERGRERERGAPPLASFSRAILQFVGLSLSLSLDHASTSH
jgi:hypothetical protein